MSSSSSDGDRFAHLVVALVVLGMIAAMVSTVADLEPGPRRAVFAMFAWLVISLPIHEAGHAIAGRLMGVEIKRFVLGYGPTVMRRDVRGVDFVLHAYPVQGFVSFEGLEDASRPAKVFVYAAGVGAEAIAVGLAWLVFRGAPTGGHEIDAGRAIAVTGLASLVLSAIANLIPRVTERQPNGEGGMINDGRWILDALTSRGRRR